MMDITMWIKNRFLICILNLHIDFLTVNRNFLGCSNADFHLLPFDFQDSDFYIIINDQGFVINSSNKKACQVIVEGEGYKVKFPIYDILQARKAGE